MRRIMEIICEYSPIRIKKREKGEFLAGMEKALPVLGVAGLGVFMGVFVVVRSGGLDCFFAEHCAGGFGFVCVGFVFAVEADALVDDVEFHVFNCCVRYVAYTCGG